ncbi:hypothetical protein ACIRBX_32960 [Kitasatospora sp. NPDC096147]|uniref:hypothetical protein n=1 Tax=Kitasatospora sp. NPDC096147 TaxID=3364093 RepID=UPI003817A1C5
MYGAPPARPVLTPSAGQRSRTGLLLWCLAQWVLVPLDLLLRLFWVPVLAVVNAFDDLSLDRGWLRSLVAPLTRWVGPGRLAREWGSGGPRWDAHMEHLCAVALRAYERQRTTGRRDFAGWTYLRYGSEGNALLLSPKDYRGLSSERIHEIAAHRGLVARSSGPFGITLTPATGWTSTIIQPNGPTGAAA